MTLTIRNKVPLDSRADALESKDDRYRKLYGNLLGTCINILVASILASVALNQILIFYWSCCIIITLVVLTIIVIKGEK